VQSPVSCSARLAFQGLQVECLNLRKAWLCPLLPPVVCLGILCYPITYTTHRVPCYQCSRRFFAEINTPQVVETLRQIALVAISFQFFCELTSMRMKERTHGDKESVFSFVSCWPPTSGDRSISLSQKSMCLNESGHLRDPQV